MNISGWLRLLRKIRYFDPVLMAAIAVLLPIGCLFIYGAGQHIFLAGGQIGHGFKHYWLRQMFWAVLGLGCFFIISLTDYRRLARWSLLFWTLAVTLLVLVLMVGRQINHARSWLPVLGFTLQPAELAKPAVLLCTAWTLGQPPWRLSGWAKFFLLLPLVAAPLGLILLQPDWGTALVFLPMILAAVFVAGLPWRWVALGLLLAGIGGPLFYRYAPLKPYQRARITTFLHPRKDTTRSGWNAYQALLAVGSGGFHGKGFMKGSQYILGFLPRRVTPTDFIFSVIGEETGFLGASLVVVTFAFLIFSCLRIALAAPDLLGVALAAGAAGLVFTHAYLNIGMNIGVAPIIGIPLPLVSYGGSFMIAVMGCLGLVQSVHVHANLPENKPAG